MPLCTALYLAVASAGPACDRPFVRSSISHDATEADERNEHGRMRHFMTPRLPPMATRLALAASARATAASGELPAASRWRCTWALGRDCHIGKVGRGLGEAEGQARVVVSMQNDRWRVWPE